MSDSIADKLEAEALLDELNEMLDALTVALQRKYPDVSADVYLAGEGGGRHYLSFNGRGVYGLTVAPLSGDRRPLRTTSRETRLLATSVLPKLEAALAEAARRNRSASVRSRALTAIEEARASLTRIQNLPNPKDKP